MNFTSDVNSTRKTIAALVVALMSNDNHEIEAASVEADLKMTALRSTAEGLRQQGDLSDQNLCMVMAAAAMIEAANDEGGTADMAVIASSILKIVENQA